jgi:hypothetical protein
MFTIINGIEFGTFPTFEALTSSVSAAVTSILGKLLHNLTTENEITLKLHLRAFLGNLKIRTCANLIKLNSPHFSVKHDELKPELLS